MHKLLQRQLKQARRSSAEGAVELELLLELVDAAYAEVDRERRFTAHAYQVMRDEQAQLADRQLKAHEMMGQMRAQKAEAERARAVAETELLKQERLSVLGRLTATVAHELRNPLSAIRNSAHALRELTKALAAPVDRPLGRIERSIARCDGIINDLLEYARSRELQLRPVALDAWLAELLDEQTVPAEVRIERSLAAAGLKVALDPERFRRVIINLIDNAAQAVAELAPDGPRGRIAVTTHTGALAEISIEDNGPGIAPEVLPRIFEPLFSTKSFGTGLGLPTVKQIVEQHGGVIEIASTPGAGARATIRLPVASEACDPADAAAA